MNALGRFGVGLVSGFDSGVAAAAVIWEIRHWKVRQVDFGCRRGRVSLEIDGHRRSDARMACRMLCLVTIDVFLSRLHSALHDDLQHLIAGPRRLVGQTWSVNVGREEQGKTARAKLEQIAGRLVKHQVFFRIVRLSDFQVVAQRRIAHPLHALGDKLHVEILSMGFPLGVGRRLRIVALHDRENRVAVDRVTPDRKLGEICLGQILQCLGDIRAQIAIQSGVFQTIENHGLRFPIICLLF